MRMLHRIHIAIYAYLVRWFRIRTTLKVFASAHRQELKETPIFSWPLVMARQSKEIEAVKAGKLDQAITDRKSWAWPFLPASVNRLSTPLLKSTPYNLRRMSRTPVPRRAINLIKGALISQPWAIRPIDGEDPLNEEDEQQGRIKIAKTLFSHPNASDSFQTFIEQGLEDALCFGGFVAELAVTPDPERPLKLWNVNVESVRLFPAWAESTPDMPRYAQMTGLKGERGAILFYEDELLYVKDNPSTDNPFGLGCMEIAFSSIADFLGIQGMAGRAGTDQIHKCFPEWTEVLTRRGWIPWRDAINGDEFATRSIDGQFQWQKPLGFVREWHEGDLIQFRNRNLRISVTPNHRMYGECTYKVDGKRTSEPLGFIEADKLFRAATRQPQGNGKPGGSRTKSRGRSLVDFKIPAYSRWDDGVLPSPRFTLGAWSFDWEDWAAFLGIWIAEGSFLGTARKRGEYRIQIAQSKQANKATYRKIEALLKRMGVRYQAKQDRFIFVDRDIWEYLSVLGNQYVRFVPQWVKDAPPAIIETFVTWALLGDGIKNTGTYLTVSKRLADDMQELYQKIGRSAAIGIHVQRDSMLGSQFIHGEGHILYRVEQRRRAKIRIVPDRGRGKQRIPVRIPYSGMVYCAMVPNGTLYCRENGKAFWSGNTFLWWEAPQNEAHIQIVRRHVQNELEGQAKLSLIAGMKKPEAVEVTPVTEGDLLLNWQELLIRMIANAFNMSPLSLGVERDVNRSTGEVLMDADFRSAVVPMAKRLQEAFTRKVIHKKLGWTDLEFVFLNLDDPDITTRIDMYGRLYSMNAITPNAVLKGLNRPPMDSPLADLTQFECMLLNAEVMSYLQDQAAAKNMKRQMAIMGPAGPGPGEEPPPEGQQQDQQPEEQGQPGQGPAGKTEKKITAPTKLALPKFPIQGSRYNARQIAMMPVNRVTDVLTSSGLRASQFLRALDEQEPGILSVLTDEVKLFFQKQLDDESKKPKPLSPKTLNKWKRDLAIKVADQNKRVSDMSDWLYKVGTTGKPSFSPSNKAAGKPGDINPKRPMGI